MTQKVYGEIKDQADVDSLSKLSRDWQLLFNASKCKCMNYILGKKNNKHNYIIAEEMQTELEETTVKKDQGMSLWVNNE